MIQPDPLTFPDGIAPIAQYAHSLKLKFGLYSDAGTNTCQGRPGSLGYEQIDATTYAAWGVDYLKYDNCNNEGIPPRQRYPTMRDALAAAGRPIFYSMCEWGQDDPALWAPAVGNSWRTTGDISNSWGSMMGNILRNDVWWPFAAPGGWNDPDMLECPNPAQPGALTESEFRVHFTLWAVAKAPLIIGCTLSSLSQETLAVLRNDEVIAVNQDDLGVQGRLIRHDIKTDVSVWYGPLAGQKSVLAVVNGSPSLTSNATLTFAEMGFPKASQVSIRDIYQHLNLGTFSAPYSVVNIPPRSGLPRAPHQGLRRRLVPRHPQDLSLIHI